MKKFPCLIVALLLLSRFDSAAQSEPQGVLVYHEPLTSYIEATEYRSFRQDNALYATAFTATGEKKKLKSGAVIALVPYPPATFADSFEETAANALHRIETLEAQYSQVKPQLEVARGKWSRALNVSRQNQIPRVPSAPLAHSSVPPVSVRSSVEPRPALAVAQTDGSLTSRIEARGRRVIGSAARILGLEDRTFSVWTFFVVLPGLVIILLVTVILMALRPPITKLPPVRPVR